MFKFFNKYFLDWW